MTFFDKYSFKQKNYGLIVLSVLLIAVTYKRAISITIEKRSYSNELSTKLTKAETAFDAVRNKQIMLSNLNRHLGEENNSVEQVQQDFLNFFAKNSKGLKVMQIHEVLNYKHPDFEINTHKIVLAGGYLNSIKFIYDLEQEFNAAKILNVSYKLWKEPNQESQTLHTTLLIQNFLR
ncbi:MAG: hypothetical protein MK105_04770 [Crocinitomicaceae bacterium]|nr:hypothetical protein [Crocinitomicaceae bacterium]